MRAKSASSAAQSHAHSRRSEEHTSELQSQSNLVCRLLLEKKKKKRNKISKKNLRHIAHSCFHHASLSLSIVYSTACELDNIITEHIKYENKKMSGVALRG